MPAKQDARKKLVLNDADRLVIIALQHHGVFEKIQAHLLPAASRKGTMVIGCSDCDQFDHLFRSHKKECKCRRVHPHFNNGGALWLSPEMLDEEALAKRSSSVIDIRNTPGIKGIETVCLYFHGPCGVAKERGLHFWDLVYHVALGKRHLKQVFSNTNLKFVCFCHVDFGNGVKETFFVNMKKWVERQDQLGKIVRSAPSLPSRQKSQERT